MKRKAATLKENTWNKIYMQLITAKVWVRLREEEKKIA